VLLAATFALLLGVEASCPAGTDCPAILLDAQVGCSSAQSAAMHTS
jgi:hypothetical protein